MKRKQILDSFALVAYLNKERGYQRVRDVMSEVEKSGNKVLMNEINIGDVYYILFRKRGAEKADYFLDTILEALPISTISNSFDHVIEAARIKAEYSLSYADCFIAAMARRQNGIILTGDPEFKKIEHLVDIEWIEG